MPGDILRNIVSLPHHDTTLYYKEGSSFRVSVVGKLPLDDGVYQRIDASFQIIRCCSPSSGNLTFKELESCLLWDSFTSIKDTSAT